MAVAHRPAQHGRAGKVHLARLENDRLVKRLPLEPVVLAEEYPEEDGVFGNLHGCTDRFTSRCMDACGGELSKRKSYQPASRAAMGAFSSGAGEVSRH